MQWKEHNALRGKWGEMRVGVLNHLFNGPAQVYLIRAVIIVCMNKRQGILRLFLCLLV